MYKSLKANPPRYPPMVQSHWYPPNITTIKYSKFESNISHSTSRLLAGYTLYTILYYFTSDVELCACVNDVTANGVLEMLAVHAKKYKYYSVDQR